MKQLIYLSSILFFVACAITKEPIKFDWLLGSWERTNNSEGTKTYEYWSKKSDTEYIGLGCTLKNSDTIFKETIRLNKHDGLWSFDVVGVNEGTTIFKCTAITELSFSCENKVNDFPKTIQYSFEGDALKAVISDGTNEIPFLFKKQ